MATRETWAERVRDWKRSGMTAAEYAERKGLKAGTLKWWSSQLNRTTPATSRPPVVEVTVAPTRAESSLEVVLVSGVQLAVPVGFDEAGQGRAGAMSCSASGFSDIRFLRHQFDCIQAASPPWLREHAGPGSA